MVSSPLDHKTSCMSHLFPDDPRHQRPTDPEIITLVFPVQIYLGHFNLGNMIHLSIAAMLFGNSTLGFVHIYKMDFHSQPLYPGSDVSPLLAQMDFLSAANWLFSIFPDRPKECLLPSTGQLRGRILDTFLIQQHLRPSGQL